MISIHKHVWRPYNTNRKSHQTFLVLQKKLLNNLTMQNEDAGPTICLHMASASYTWPGKLVYWFKAVGSNPAFSVVIQFPLLPLFQKPNTC